MTEHKGSWNKDDGIQVSTSLSAFPTLSLSTQEYRCLLDSWVYKWPAGLSTLQEIP